MVERVTSHFLGFPYDHEFLAIDSPDAYPRASKNDVVFLQLKSGKGKACGSARIAFQGKIVLYWASEYTYELADIKISFCIPWFLWGLS